MCISWTNKGLKTFAFARNSECESFITSIFPSCLQFLRTRPRDLFQYKLITFRNISYLVITTRLWDHPYLENHNKGETFKHSSSLVLIVIVSSTLNVSKTRIKFVRVQGIKSGLFLEESGLILPDSFRNRTN